MDPGLCFGGSFVVLSFQALGPVWSTPSRCWAEFIGACFWHFLFLFSFSAESLPTRACLWHFFFLSTSSSESLQGGPCFSHFFFPFFLPSTEALANDAFWGHFFFLSSSSSSESLLGRLGGCWERDAASRACNVAKSWRHLEPLFCKAAVGGGREITGPRPAATGAAEAHSGSSNMRDRRAGSLSPRSSPRAELFSGSRSAHTRQNGAGNQSVTARGC